MSITSTTSRKVFVGSLENALAFNGDDVIERFLRRFDVSDVEAAELFEDTKRFLWLGALARVERHEKKENVPSQIVIDTPMLIVDQMWHNFICFTKLYQEYCESKFGKLIHHAPTMKAQVDRMIEKAKADPDYQLNRKRIQYSYVFDKLGKETLTRWYLEYPKKYTVEGILALRKA